MHQTQNHHGKPLAIALAAALSASLAPVSFAPALAQADTTATDEIASSGTSTGLTELDTNTTKYITPDADGFFAALSENGKATADTKIGFSALENFGIYFDADAAAKDGVANTHVTESGSGSLSSPATSGSITGASISYTQLYTITLDQAVFDKAAQLTYVNNNGIEVSYNKRDVIQAVLYAIAKTTQASSFKGKKMYQVVVDYNGTIDLTNAIFIYSNTWLKLGTNTVLKKQFQSDVVKSERGESFDAATRQDAENRKIDFTSQGVLRNTVNEYDGGGYTQCQNIVIDGGTWDMNLETYNAAKLGSVYQCTATKFNHMHDLVIQNTTIKGTNHAHHLEFGGVRGATVNNCTFTGYDGTLGEEAIQIEPLHSRPHTPQATPYDDTPTRNVVIYNSNFTNCSRGIGNHFAVLGLDSSRIYIYKNRFQNLTAQAILTVGMRTMRIEGNTMTNVKTGVDVRIIRLSSDASVVLPLNEGYTYDELVADGYLNRNITIVKNTISATGTSGLNATNAYGSAISVRGQKIPAGTSAVASVAAGSYTITGVTISGNTIKSARGTGARFYNTSGCTFANNTVKAVSAYSGRGIGLYTYSARKLAVTGNTIKSTATEGIHLTQSKSVAVKKNTLKKTTGYGIFLESSSNSATISGNTIAPAGKNEAVYATTDVTGAKVTNSKIRVKGSTAITLGTKETTSYTSVTHTRKTISGKTAVNRTVTAYVSSKEVGSAKSGKKGAFTIKFKKKLAKGTTVQLRYKDASGNSIRRSYTI